MTNVDREAIMKRLKEFDYLNQQIEFADDIIDAIDDRLDVIAECKMRVQNLEILICVDGTQRPFYFDEEQVKNLKEFLDSYRCDVRKRMEEI